MMVIRLFTALITSTLWWTGNQAAAANYIIALTSIRNISPRWCDLGGSVSVKMVTCGKATRLVAIDMT